MTLEDPSAVDAAGIENETGFAILTIADSWDWSDVHAHLSAVQKKLNAYFEFIESGQIFESYPAAKGRKVVIDVVGRFPLPAAAKEFFDRASKVAAELDVAIRCRTFQGTIGDGSGPS